MRRLLVLAVLLVATPAFAEPTTLYTSLAAEMGIIQDTDGEHHGVGAGRFAVGALWHRDEVRGRVGGVLDVFGGREGGAGIGVEAEVGGKPASWGTVAARASISVGGPDTDGVLVLVGPRLHVDIFDLGLDAMVETDDLGERRKAFLFGIGMTPRGKHGEYAAIGLGIAVVVSLILVVAVVGSTSTYD